mgnify:CR=1 FL=1
MLRSELGSRSMGLIAVQSPSKTRSLQTPQLEIRGGRRLSGELHVSGAKNSALVLMAACLLTRETIRLRNVPPLTDIAAMGGRPLALIAP